MLFFNDSRVASYTTHYHTMYNITWIMYIVYIMTYMCAGPKPVLRVVSFHADDTNRSPTFDMDLTELLQDGQPISYSEARTYFKSDPATRSVILLALLASVSHVMHDDPSLCACETFIPKHLLYKRLVWFRCWRGVHRCYGD